MTIIKIIKIRNENDQHDEGQFFLLAPANLNPNIIIYKFMKRLNMKPDSFSFNYCKNIIHAILSTRRNQNDIYQCYYIEEYNDFDQFLYHKLLLNDNQIEVIKKYSQQDECLYTFDISLVSYNISTFLEYEPRLVESINIVLGEL